MRTHHQKGALGAKQQLPKHTFHPNIYLFHLKCFLHILLLEKEKKMYITCHLQKLLQSTKLN